MVTVIDCDRFFCCSIRSLHDPGTYGRSRSRFGLRDLERQVGLRDLFSVVFDVVLALGSIEGADTTRIGSGCTETVVTGFEAG
jgi:hypothetical protein